MPNAIFINPPAIKPPDNISKAFYELGEYTRNNYKFVSVEMQEMIFCVAYALYAKEKKSFSNWYVENNNDHSILSKSHQRYCNNESYRLFCEDAVNAITCLSDITAKDVIKQISSVVVSETSEKLGKDISSISKSVSRIDKSLNDEKNHNNGMIAFIRHSFAHALHILLAATIIYIVARIILYLAPFAEDQAKHHLAPILDLFTNRENH